MMGIKRSEFLVALRKESVDRNKHLENRAQDLAVALRKESVDRNTKTVALEDPESESLSARRAWIEMLTGTDNYTKAISRSPQGERG